MNFGLSIPETESFRFLIKFVEIDSEDGTAGAWLKTVHMIDDLNFKG